jgi:peptidoglycan-associated lipoprotein
MINKRKIALATLSLTLAMFADGCKKEPPPPPPPPPAPVQPPAPARPTVTISAEPNSIERGRSATLRWSSSNATSASLNQGIGTVPASGSREIFPTNATTYTIEVTGPGGNATASVEVAVRAPAPPPPPAPVARDDFSTALRRSVNDAYFDYDKYDIRADAEGVLRSNSSALKDLFATYTDGRVLVEGHCDERGTNEYNLALGDRRATAAKDFLVNLGVSAARLSTVSYGEERPQCTTADDACWQRNRRAHFTVAP